MIVFQYQTLEDFLGALKYRVIDEVFSRYIEPETEMGAASNRHELILQFLGHPDSQNTNILGLYQIKVDIKTKQERDSIITHLKEAFKKTGKISLIQGSISEIYRSIG